MTKSNIGNHIEHIDLSSMFESLYAEYIQDLDVTELNQIELKVANFYKQNIINAKNKPQQEIKYCDSSIDSNSVVFFFGLDRIDFKNHNVRPEMEFHMNVTEIEFCFINSQFSRFKSEGF